MAASTLIDAAVDAVIAALAGTEGVGKRIFEDRTQAYSPEEAPALNVMLRSGEATTLGDNSPVLSMLSVDVELDIAVYTRSHINAQGKEEPARKLASAVHASAHKRLMADPSLGGLATRLRWRRFRIESDGADGAAGWTVHTYELRLVMREQTLLAP